MPAPKVNFNHTNLTQTVSSTVKGVNFVIGRSIRGPINDPSTIINSWTNFVNLFGGLTNTSPAPLLCKRLLEQGGSIRFCRVANYVAIEDPATLTATKAGGITVQNVTLDPLFSLRPKYAGEDYNNLRVVINAGTNGQPGYFNLTIQHTTDLTLVERYENLKIVGKPTLEKASFLSRVSLSSQLVDVEYRDLSYLPEDMITPELIDKQFTGGTDGNAITDTDYIGDSASRTGFYAFDPYQDAMQVAVFDNDADVVHVAGSNYAANRKDLVYFLHLNNDLVTPTALIAKRDSLNIDSKYTYFVAGGIKLRDPLTGQVLNVNGIADVMALVNKSDQDYGEWYSFSGNTRGLVSGALGVVNNYGAPASHKDLDNLIDAGINMIINRDNRIKLWGNQSGQFTEDQERFISVVRMVITLKKSLRPTLENFIEEPNDIPTWKRLFYTVKPYMDSLVDKRALFFYDWQGDQFARNVEELTINNPADITQGKYKVRLGIKVIPSIQEITIDLILTPAGVDFEILSELL